MPYIQPQATNLPDNLYTRGAEVFNTPQYFNYIEQAKARREAKQEAVDNYYRDLSKDLTSAGMAGNDVNDFTDKVNNWRDFTIKNREVLSNPQDPHYADVSRQAGYLYNDAQQLSSTSKDKVKQLADARLLIKPEHPLTDSSVMMMHNATLPISQGYQPLDLSQFAYQPDQEKPATVEDLAKYENAVKNGLQMSEGQPSIIVDPKTKSKVITTKSFYEPQALNVIAKRAGLLYQTDPKFYKMVNDASTDPANYAALNEAYKKAYGKDLDIQHPEQFAAALLLGQTEKTNTQPMAYSPTIVNVNGSTAQQTQAEMNNSIDQLVDNQIEQAKQSGQWGSPKPLPVDPATLKSFGVNQLLLSPDGQSVIPVTNYVTKDPKTQEDVVTPTQGTPFSIEQYKAAIGKKNVGSKYFEKKTTPTAPPPKQETKAYKYNGKTYTTDQLAKAAQASGMSLDDYLKQLGLK